MIIMILRSNFNVTLNHPNFVASTNGDYESIVNSLFSHFEDEIRLGKRFNADQTIQFGWMILMLKSDSHGDLELWEPDFGAMPINWEFSLDRSLRDLYLQRELCLQVGVEPNFPSLLERGIVSPAFLLAKEFTMNREVQQDGDSGWLFLEHGGQGNEGRFCSLFEVAMNVPWVTPFLALPPGSGVACNSSAIEIRAVNKVISSNDNELLKKLWGGWRSNEYKTFH
ncbi:hypothetical protein [Burkholderia pseudomultivorans]|uniref:immunity protein Imm33 domain-containing protein n=1 Tax=Burkholderia pseudomultivorans TaxID=1207504 RepID=UPI0018C8D3C2|nr:hypothetical protein [Burkholderia pseudomultivorans]